MHHDQLYATIWLMNSIKSLFFTFVFMTFILVFMSQSPQLQGLPLEAKLAHVAGTTMMYINEFIAPVRHLFYNY
ncbi:MAG: hypothetical protein EAY76_01075 [Alphaproteobacteria bacterium]|nr:MAG: hypothetical protein EAY76_01075 [Alphaproteobacteria bacterium]TAF76975.1 MAG: hypothetical protein EAZ52_02315 [Alphaproteobacteria bacterium]